MAIVQRKFWCIVLKHEGVYNSFSINIGNIYLYRLFPPCYSQQLVQKGVESMILSFRFSGAKVFWYGFFLFCSVAIYPKFLVAEGNELQNCLQEMVESAPDNMTIGQLRAECQKRTNTSFAGNVQAPQKDAAEKRLAVDEENVLRPYTLMAHRQNYILLAAHNFQGYDTSEFSDTFGEEDFSFKNTETQFQLSVKTPLANNIFDRNMDVFAAYTVRSFWQVYQKDISSPFRETNHQPEVWLQLHPNYELFGFQNSITALGVAHQSNGRSGGLSRSWNTLFANFVFHKDNFVISIKPWVRIAEELDNDDNPDITDFLGHGELRLIYTHADHTFSLMSRNNLESGFSKGAVELGWSFPLFGYPYIKGYLQYFSGYGESLIDYDRYVNRIGVGLLFTDLL